MTPSEALKKVVKHVGTQEKLAAALGTDVVQADVSRWINKNKKVPAEYAIPCAMLTDGEVKAHELRPDIFKDVTVIVGDRVA